MDPKSSYGAPVGVFVVVLVNVLFHDLRSLDTCVCYEFHVI